MGKATILTVFLLAVILGIGNAVTSGEKPNADIPEIVGQNQMQPTGDVTIHLNGGDDVAYIGDTNIVEIWIKNSIELAGMDLSLAFLIGRNYEFDSTYYNTNSYVKPEGDVYSHLELHAEIPAIDNTYPDSIRFGSADMFPPRLPIHDSHVLAYTMQVYIPPNQLEYPGGFCVDNVYDYYTWIFIDEYAANYHPTFQGNPHDSAPPVCFDIVDTSRTICGDVNCDRSVNISDAVWIINYVFAGGNSPCDMDGDGVPDC